jgi:hypothetical protein
MISTPTLAATKDGCRANSAAHHATDHEENKASPAAHRQVTMRDS